MLMEDGIHYDTQGHVPPGKRFHITGSVYFEHGYKALLVGNGQETLPSEANKCTNFVPPGVFGLGRRLKLLDSFIRMGANYVLLGVAQILRNLVKICHKISINKITQSI